MRGKLLQECRLRGRVRRVATRKVCSTSLLCPLGARREDVGEVDKGLLVHTIQVGFCGVVDDSDKLEAVGFVLGAEFCENFAKSPS